MGTLIFAIVAAVCVLLGVGGLIRAVTAARRPGPAGRPGGRGVERARDGLSYLPEPGGSTASWADSGSPDHGHQHGGHHGWGGGEHHHGGHHSGSHHDSGSSWSSSSDFGGGGHHHG
jgi:hypothetical protein